MKKIIFVVFALLFTCFLPGKANAFIPSMVKPSFPVPATVEPEPTDTPTDIDQEPPIEDEITPDETEETTGDEIPDDSDYNNPEDDFSAPTDETTADTEDTGSWFEDLFNISTVDNNDESPDLSGSTESSAAPAQVKSSSIKKCLSPLWLWLLIGAALFFFLAFLVMLLLFLFALANTAPEKKKGPKNENTSQSPPKSV